jgi:hypothetical protein
MIGREGLRIVVAELDRSLLRSSVGELEIERRAARGRSIDVKARTFFIESLSRLATRAFRTCLHTR